MISEITCTSCGAPVKIKINSSKASCNFCGLDINIVTEVFDQEIGFNGNRVDYSEFQKILELLKISKRDVISNIIIAIPSMDHKKLINLY